MPITTYAELKTAIGSWAEADDVDDNVDTLIDLVEARHKKEIRIRDMLTRDEAFTIDSRYEALPDPFLEAKKLRILLDSGVVILDQVTSMQMDRVRRQLSSTPQYFSVEEQIEFDVVPYTSFTGELLYYAPLTALSDADPTNAILTRSPGAYLWGALAMAATLEWEDERIPQWEAMYQQERDELNRLDSKTFGVPIARVVGLTP